MRVWGKKKRTEIRRNNKRKKQGASPIPATLDHLGRAWIIRWAYSETPPLPTGEKERKEEEEEKKKKKKKKNIKLNNKKNNTKF